VITIDNRANSADGSRPQAAATPVPALIEAVQILGLKLEARKVPVDVIVVDSAQKVPSEN